ncbi:MAG: hypothetical protein IH616_22475 [Gemmatimonadales bacterium]|nr:hypothetical protein [Gemmatimonadales bacterium]
MGRVISWLIRIVFVVLLLGVGSYAGARFKAGQLLGPKSPIHAPVSAFAYKGVPDLPGRPRAWVFTYTQSQLPGVARVRIVVSPTGRVLSVTPADLEAKLEAYRRSFEP